MDPLSDIPSASTPSASSGDPLSDIPKADTSLSDAHNEAIQHDPNHVAKALDLSKRGDIDPNYVLGNLPAVEKTATAPDLNIKTRNPALYALLNNAPHVMGIASDDVHANGSLAMLENHAKTAKIATSMLEAAKAGWQDSVRGRELAHESPDTVLGPNPSLLNESVAQGVGMAVDLPEFVSFGALGAMVGPVTGTAAAFGGHAALKQALIERDHGSIDSAAELLRRSKAIAFPAAKGAVTGAALAVTGGAAAAYGATPAAKLALEIGAMSTTGAAAEGRMVTARDFISNSIAFLGAHAASLSWEKMGEVAEGSKIRGRGDVGAQTFADHADTVSGPAYVPVEKWDALHGADVQEVNKQLGIEQSYAAAKASGGDIEIPAGKFLSAEMDPHREALKEDVKSDPEAKTINQLKDEAEARKEEAKKAAETPEEGIDVAGRKGALVMGDAIPAPETGHALLTAAPEVKREFTERVMPHVEGIAEALGVKAKSKSGEGLFAGEVGPNVLSELDPSATPDKVGQYARAVQYVLRQKAVPWAKAAGDGYFAGFHLEFEGMDEAKAAKFKDLLTGALTDKAGYTKLGDKVVVVNYGEMPEDDFKQAIHDLAEEHGKELGLKGFEGYRTGGDYGPEHDWSKDPAGESLLQGGAAEGSPDLQKRLSDAHSAVKAIADEYSDGKSHPAVKPTLPYTPYPGLSNKQRAAETNFARILSNPDSVEKYAALPKTEGGKVLDVDELRNLSHDYSQSNASRMAHTLSTHKPASAWIRQEYLRKLSEPAKGQVLFMAGGGGSGKSTVRNGILKETSKAAEIVMDGTLSKEPIARDQIEAALESGRQVRITYVHRSFESAVQGIVARAKMKEGGGRWVPSATLANDHVMAQETFKMLAEHYRGDPRVVLRIFDNPDSRPESNVVPREISLDRLHELSYTQEGESPSSAIERLTEVARKHNGELEREAEEAGRDQPRGNEQEGSGAGRGNNAGDEEGNLHPVSGGVGEAAALTPLQQREQATSQAVAAAHQETGQTVEPVDGVDPRDQAELDRAAERARKEAEKILLKPQLEEIKRSNVKLLAEERMRATKEIKNQINNEPVFKAISLLDMGDKQMWQMAHKYINSDLDNEATLHFEAVAEMSGFSSAAEMAHKLLLTERIPTMNMLLKERVNQHMEQFAHLKDTDAMREEALRAVHNEHSGELISLQSQVLEGMAQNAEINADTARARRAYANEMWEASKQLARNTINAKPVESAGKFRAYYTAERNAAVKAQKLEVDGKYQEAGAARLEQMHSHALAAESLRVKDRIESWHNSIEKQQASEPKSWKSEDNFFQAAAILNRFGFPREDFDPSKRVENLQSWAARMDEKSSGMVSIPAWLQDESVTKDWRKLTPPELQDVRNALNNIKHVANAEDKMFYIGNGIELEALANDLHDAKVANVQGGKTPGAGTYQSDWQKLTHAKDVFLNNIIAPETFMSELDGFKMKGLWQDTLIESKNKAMDARGEMNAEDAAKLREIHSAYSPKELRDMHKPIYIPELDPKGQFTKDNLITLAANQGTEGNQVKVREGRGWSQYQVDAALAKHLDARDWDLVQAKLDWMESRKPLMAELHKRVTGFEPTWVPAKPIQTPFGEKPGGYYPLISDHRVVARGFENMKVDAMLNDPPVTFKAATQQGFMKERNDNARYAVSLDGSGFVRHMSDVTHDLTMREWVIDASRVLGNKGVAADIQDAFGMENYQGLKTWLKQVAGNDVKPLREAIDGIAAGMRRRSTVSQLGGKLSVMFSQIHGLTAAASVDPENFGRTDVVAGIMNVYGKTLMNPSSFHETMELVDSKSPYMKQSGMDADRDIAEAARSISGNDTNVMQFAQKGFKMMHDLTMKPLWLQAYKVGLRVHEGSEEAAISYADKIIRGSTTGGRASDMPAIMRGSETGKLLTMFHGFVNAQTQLMYKASGRVHDAGDIAAFAGTYMNVMVLPGAMYALFHYGMPTDKKSEKMWQKAMLRSASPLSMVPVVSTLQDWAIDRALGIPGHTSFSPAGGGLDALYDLMQVATSRKAHTQKVLESATKLASYTGLPIPGRVPGLGNMFMQAYPDQYNTWLWNTVDAVHNGMTPRPSDLMKRRPARERSH